MRALDKAYPRPGFSCREESSARFRSSAPTLFCLLLYEIDGPPHISPLSPSPPFDLLSGRRTMSLIFLLACCNLVAHHVGFLVHMQKYRRMGWRSQRASDGMSLQLASLLGVRHQEDREEDA